MPKIIVDFYQAVLPEGVATLEELFDQVSALPIQSRLMTRHDTVHYLADLTRRNGLLYGRMVKIRMQDVPVLARLDGYVGDLPLREDEGVGEETSFLYSARHNILAMQRNWHGTRASTFLAYLEHITRVAPLELQAVLGEDAMRTLRRMTVIRRFEVRLANRENPEDLKGRGLSVDRMVDLLSHFAAVRIDVAIGMTGESRFKSMNRQSVINAALSLLRLRSEDDRRVTRLRVLGKNEEDERLEVLDLIENRMREEVTVDREGRRVTPAVCRDALTTAFMARRDELDRMFTDARR